MPTLRPLKMADAPAVFAGVDCSRDAFHLVESRGLDERGDTQLVYELELRPEQPGS